MKLIANNIIKIQESDTNLIYIDASVNIDGLPLFKSSPLSLWPILIDFDHKGIPLPISVYCGYGKPNFEEFLPPFINEVQEMKTVGMEVEVAGIHMTLKFGKVIYVCDAPARAALMCVKGHTAKLGCAFCRAEGIYYHNRVSFSTVTKEPRTDQAYAENNQLGLSLLAPIANLYSDIPVDYQHNVCLGVVRKLFKFYF
jgi:hypothetical protein